MKKSECLSIYENELLKQETPYQQWILKNESQDYDKCEEVDQLSLRVIKMEEFTSSFDFSVVEDKILLFVGSEGILAPDAESVIYNYFKKHNDVDIVYADEDELDVKMKERSNPWFKPEYAPDSLLSSFYFGHIFAIRVDKFREIAQNRGQDYKINIYDFVLRAVELADSIHHIPMILYHQTKSNTYQDVLGTEDIFDMIKIEACQRRNMQVYLANESETQQDNAKNEGHSSIDRKKETIRHICYKIENNPLVSVIIPSKDHAEILEKCITSFLEKTAYRNVEFIIVDNGSCQEQKERIIHFLKQEFDDNEQLNCYYDYEESPFNFSKMCNRGAERALGEYLLFLNDDIEIISPDWLERMLGQAMQPHVGAVGAKLLYPEENRIQHIGITNMGIGPAHKLNGLKDNQVYLHGENCLVLNKIAVTAACLLVSKEKFEKAGKFPSDMAVAYNDVSLCFSLLKHGYLNVVRNDVALLHHESLSRGLDDTNEKKSRLLREKKLLYSRYPKWEGRDPYYSKNWIQLRKDIDYTCNFIYDFEDVEKLNRMTTVSQEKAGVFKKKKSNNKLIRKILKQDALSFSIDMIQDKRAVEKDGKKVFYYDTFDKEETGYLYMDGWIVIQGEDNACYDYRYLLEDEHGKIYECKTFPKLRHDVEKTFQETKACNTALAGRTSRISTEVLPAGIYKIGAVARSLLDNRYTYIKWSEEYLLFFLKK